MNLQNTKEIINEIRGLSDSEVNKSKTLHGSNHLVQKNKRSFFREFLSSFGDPIIKILLIALVVNIVIMMRNFNWYETCGIAAAILISTFVSTLSEHGSESAFEKLQEDALKTKCRVKRKDGLLELPVTDIVVGDYVLLQAGDRIPADGIVIAGELYVDQSPLNGESKEVYKAPSSQTMQIDSTGFDNRTNLYRGCVICSGEAVMLVKSVGSKTFYGNLADDIQESSRESPLKLRLGKLAESISKFGYIGAALVAVSDLFNSIVIANKFNPAAIMLSLDTFKEITSYIIHAATLAISVIVVAIPEGLPLMITVVLSSNMKRMLKDKVLVRKLVGIETSGNLNILFTDKTGTITKGRPKVTSFITGSGKAYDIYTNMRKTEIGKLLKLSVLYNTGASFSKNNKKLETIGGNTTERALLEFIKNDPYPSSDVKVVKSIPFNSTNKYSAAQISGDMNLTLIKGAPEIILSHCSNYYDESGEKKKIVYAGSLRKAMDEMASNAVRLLALAISDVPLTSNKDFSNLTLVGIIGIRDEVRREAVQAIKQVTKAGVQVVMITGDNKQTATAIAREVGLIHPNDDYAVMTSDELKELTDKELKERIRSLHVVARALPSDKSRLVRISQELELVVGMTGDGINDAPALKKADVGFAMGSGTEVAKEASDIIIMDDNFLS
ncbi:MAG: HAD-IC family P-type ATPase, partial [Clostridiales bacterium]|nr:HAD-IC family P-type ATPase [Clostridiales bacterium]